MRMTFATAFRACVRSSLLYIIFAPMALGQTIPPLTDGPTGGSFTVHDGRASDELSEASRLYINGHLAATFHLDLAHASTQSIIAIPLGWVDLPYTLCGTITLIRDGHVETRTVSGEGTLHNPDGHFYEAVGTDSFKDFYLIDEDDPTASDHRSGASSRCLSSNT